jgi:hypothetical protein
MGPCVRRDDPPRACARQRPHQRAAQFRHMRFPCRVRGEVGWRVSAIRVRGALCEPEPVEAPPHPNPLPAHGEREFFTTMLGGRK